MIPTGDDFNSPQKQFVLDTFPSAICYEDDEEFFTIYARSKEDDTSEVLSDGDSEAEAWDESAESLGFYTQFSSDDDSPLDEEDEDDD